MSRNEEIEQARKALTTLVKRFRHNEQAYLNSGYNETQARTDFISPLLEEVFGWDVSNSKQLPPSLREVYEEATVEIKDEKLSKRPDYELRLARQRKLFVEAKKPSVNIEHDRNVAFQVRRYGFSANLPVSILTNFRHIAVYDCSIIPQETDAAHVGRLLLIRFDEFHDRLDELWDILARSSIYSGRFDAKFEAHQAIRPDGKFDRLFLGQIKQWRECLALDVFSSQPHILSGDLTYVVQLFLTRLIFLRICEDRELEKYETLRSLDQSNTYGDLIDVIKRADSFYNSGIFRLVYDDKLGVRISDSALQRIISELYYPKSPYTFAVVEPEVLGDIYEQFLGEEIVITEGRVDIITKPEVREGGGVVPTPGYIADAIIERTLNPKLKGKSPDDLAGFTVADICCGSGVFLLSSYVALLDHYLEWYKSNNRSFYSGRTIYETGAGEWQLTFAEKRRILLEHIRGVDIDPSAVEVAQFSLLLKLIDGQSLEDLREFHSTTGHQVLPDLAVTIRSGNSLVRYSEWHAQMGPISLQEAEVVRPLTWESEFPDELGNGGFDVIVGNPPYIRIQNMARYSPDEVSFYRSFDSPYTTAQAGSFDKYALFIERSLSLIAEDGRIGVIIPHKFMSTTAGAPLRKLIGERAVLEELVHFGTQAVFPGIANYTCIMILDTAGSESVKIESVNSLARWRYGESGKIVELAATTLGESTWQILNQNTLDLFSRILAESPRALSDVADIFVGVQTSADDIYILNARSESNEMIVFEKDGKEWQIEKGILRPCLQDVSLSAFVKPKANRWMIFPYSIEGSRARVLPEDTMRTLYPQCWRYLLHYKDRLKQRSVTGGSRENQQWYQFGRSQSLAKFNSSKIILPILSKEARYAYDTSNIVVTGGGNGPYYMVKAKKDPDLNNLFLLALLNHPLSEAMVRKNTSVFTDGYYSHGKQYIHKLPVPSISEDRMDSIVLLVNQLMDTIEASNQAKTPDRADLLRRHAESMRNRIEDAISESFNLSKDDLQTISEVGVPE